MKITFIGGGNMGEAFIASLTQKEVYKPSDITVIGRTQERLDLLHQKYGVKTTTDINEVQNAKIIFLAIKPQGVETLPTFTFKKDKSPILISILAGTTVQKLQMQFVNTKVVRTMPNLGQFVGEGMTGLYFDNTTNFTNLEKEEINNIFSAGGKTVEVNEEHKIDAITAISGSGPAYAFYFLEAFETAAQELGFTAKEAKTLTRQTLVGATEILKANNNDSPQEWRKKVTSKGGTTEAACNILVNSEFKKILTQAVTAAQSKAKELGK